MQKKFFALCFLIGALGAVSLQAMNEDAGSYKFMPSWSTINNVAVISTSFNALLQRSGYATIYAQTVAPLFGWTGFMGGTIASYATPVLTKWYGVPLFAAVFIAKPLVDAYRSNGNRKQAFIESLGKQGGSVLTVFGTASLFVGLGVLGAAVTRYSTPTGLKIN